MRPSVSRRDAAIQLASLVLGLGVSPASEAYLQWLIRFLFGTAARGQGTRMASSAVAAGLRSGFKPAARFSVMKLVGHASTLGWGVIGAAELHRMFSPEQAQHLAAQASVMGVQRAPDRPVVIEAVGEVPGSRPAVMAASVALINQDHIRQQQSHADTIVVPMYQGLWQPGQKVDIRAAIPTTGIPAGDWIVSPMVTDLNRPGMPPFEGVSFTPDTQVISVR
jgi:hypothetical protein